MLITFKTFLLTDYHWRINMPYNARKITSASVYILQSYKTSA
nr:MAG TPA: hypothetical protein [Caudoviricetes sp.]